MLWSEKEFYLSPNFTPKTLGVDSIGSGNGLGSGTDGA